MRESLDRLLRDLTLVTLALAIAIGWSLIQVAEGFAELVAGLLYEIPDEDSDSDLSASSSLRGSLAYLPGTLVGACSRLARW